jgi:hypothetical protein
MTGHELIADTLNGTTRYRCPDCGRWEYEGKGAIRHAKSCDYSALQPVVAKPAQQIQRQSHEEYVRELADAGATIQPRDWDAVMNRDD